MRAFTKEWIKAAYDDILTIQEIIDNRALTHIVAFHAQQGVEKTLKAILEEYEIDTPKSHSLIRLKKLLPFEMPQLDTTLLERLDELYIESRYPGDMGLLPYGKPTTEDAQQFFDFTQNIFDEICTLLHLSVDEIRCTPPQKLDQK